jgi:hypothetical protein
LCPRRRSCPAPTAAGGRSSTAEVSGTGSTERAANRTRALSAYGSCPPSCQLTVLPLVTSGNCASITSAPSLTIDPRHSLPRRPGRLRRPEQHVPAVPERDVRPRAARLPTLRTLYRRPSSECGQERMRCAWPGRAACSCARARGRCACTRTPARPLSKAPLPREDGGQRNRARDQRHRTPMPHPPPKPGCPLRACERAVCPDGFGGGPGGVCTACPPGSAGTGFDATQPCPVCNATAASYSPSAGAPACSTCPTGRTANNDRTGCGARASASASAATLAVQQSLDDIRLVTPYPPSRCLVLRPNPSMPWAHSLQACWISSSIRSRPPRPGPVRAYPSRRLLWYATRVTRCALRARSPCGRSRGRRPPAARSRAARLSAQQTTAAVLTSVPQPLSASWARTQACRWWCLACASGQGAR